MTLLLAPAGIVAPIMTFVVGEISFRLLEAPVIRRSAAARSARRRRIHVPTPALGEA
jgi:peptidoglycan/LPS O-acetylase OafA/YrhL